MLHVNCSMCPPLKFVTYKAKKTIIFDSNLCYMLKRRVLFICFINEFFHNQLFHETKGQWCCINGARCKTKEKKFYLTS